METTEKAIPRFSRQNPVTFYLRTLLYMFMALVMRVVAFLPLGALLLFPQGSPWRWLAVLCPLLLLLFILPQRFSFAQALVQTERERRFSFDKATSVQNYGEKLAESFLHLLHLVLWGIPLLAMLGGLYYASTQVDMDQVLKGINGLGAGVVVVLYAVANFFIRIAGGVQLVPNGGMAEGLYTIGAVLALGVLILLWGAVRNSAYRYIWAYATKADKNPHAEARRRLRGRRWKQFWVAMVNLVLWVPALLVVFTSLKSMLNDLINAAYGMVLTRQMNLPDFSNALRPLLFAFLVCYMPLLPVRRILTAFFATKQIRHAQPVEVIQPTPEVTTTASGAPEPVAEPAAAPSPAMGMPYAPYGQTAAEPEAPAWTQPSPAYVPPAAPVQEPPAPVEPEPVAKAAEARPEPMAWAFQAEPAAPMAEPVAEPEPVEEPEPAAVVPVAEPEPVMEPVAEPEATAEPEPVAQAVAPVAEPETPPYAPEPDDAFAQPTPYPTIDEPELDDHAPDEDANA